MYSDFYFAIERPFFAPPEWVFGLAWGVIYPLIIIALLWLAVLVYRAKAPFFLLGIFTLNMIANLAFTPILLKYGGLSFAIVDILIVFGTLLLLEYKLYTVHKGIFWLLVPYLLWGSFATVLLFSIYFLNL